MNDFKNYMFKNFLVKKVAHRRLFSEKNYMVTLSVYNL
jgi:hypothetical protein